MPLQEVTIGDDAGLSCQLSRGGVLVPINTSATVRAAIVTKDKKKRMSSVVTINNAGLGNDWANGLVRVVILAADQNTTETESNTVKNIESGLAMLEVEVNDQSQSPGNRLNSWHEHVMVNNAAING